MQLGAYGWKHVSWNDAFYPEDLPSDWELSYYSNEFNTVLVPACYWQKAHQQEMSCDDWLDSVSDAFQFYVECSEDMFADISLFEFTENLQTLQPQLAGLVFVDEKIMPASLINSMTDLAGKLGIAVFDHNADRQNVREDDFQKDSNAIYFQASSYHSLKFVLLKNDLLDLRVARKIVDDFVARYDFEKSGSSTNDLSAFSKQATIIVKHPALFASDLVKFRSVLEIMGF